VKEEEEDDEEEEEIESIVTVGQRESVLYRMERFDSSTRYF